MREIEQARQERNAEIRRLAATMSPVAIAEQYGVHRNTVYRLLRGRWIAALSDIMPASAAAVYALIRTQTNEPSLIRSRIDVFCRVILERAVAEDYRRQLLAIHRRQPNRRFTADLPAAAASAAIVPDLLQISAACPDDPVGLRDRALLRLRHATGLSFRSLAALDVEHLCFVANAVQLTVVAASGKGPQRVIVVPCDPHPSHCPVASLRTWLTVSATQSGPVFRKSDRSGHIRQSRLGVGGARCVVERRASGTQALTAG